MQETRETRGAESTSADEMRRIIREELEQERTAEHARQQRIARGLAALAGAFFVLYLATVFLTLMTVYILGALIEPWIGAAIVGGTLLVVAIVASRRAWAYFGRMVSGRG